MSIEESVSLCVSLDNNMIVISDGDLYRVRMEVFDSKECINIVRLYLQTAEFTQRLTDNWVVCKLVSNPKVLYLNHIDGSIFIKITRNQVIKLFVELQILLKANEVETYTIHAEYIERLSDGPLDITLSIRDNSTTMFEQNLKSYFDKVEPLLLGQAMRFNTFNNKKQVDCYLTRHVQNYLFEYIDYNDKLHLEFRISNASVDSFIKSLSDDLPEHIQ